MEKMTSSLLSESLLRFWEKGHRILPWREDPTPYHVWLSEIMLQQTRVDTVRGYYLRFLDALPDIASLANASEETYLKLWEGLGYYSRVRHMHEAAKIVMTQYGGELPNTLEALLSLPGIGEYTAHAILACAFHQKAVAVDGNLIRIYARLLAKPIQAKNIADKKQVQRGFEKYQEGDPAIFNQALMEIGQTICLPNGKPLCLECPLRAFCKAHEQGKEQNYPVSSPPSLKKQLEKTVFVVTYQDKILLRKRPGKGLLASLYELPNVEGFLSLKEAENYWKSLGASIAFVEELGHAKHVFSHQVWEMCGYRIGLNSPLKGETFASKEEREDQYPLPSAFLYFLS